MLAQAKAAQRRVQSAGVQLKAAESRAQKSAALVSLAEAQLGKSDVASPVSGVVGEVLVNRGEVVDAGAALLEVVNADALRVIAQAPAAFQAQLHVGTKATVTFPHLPGKTVQTSVTVVGAMANANTGMIPIELLVPNAGRRL